MSEIDSSAPRKAPEQGAADVEPASRTTVTLPATLSPRCRVRIGEVDIDALALDEALDVVEALVEARRGGTIFTPNVDHIVQAGEDPLLREAYAEADLSLVDGVPVMWAARALGSPLPEKISGSDFVRPLIARAAERGWEIYFLGGRPGVAAKAKEVLEHEFPAVRIVGVSSPKIDLSQDVSEQSEILEAIRAARPRLLFLALGAPKQEIWAQRIREFVTPAVILGIGASLDFVAGEAKRSPRWVSALGFEWLYRLAQEPRRLWRRYLLRDPKFLAIVLRQALTRGRGSVPTRAIVRGRDPNRVESRDGDVSRVVSTVTFEQFRNTKFFPSLDGLRCLSIVAVVLFHSDSKLPGLLGARGSAGVDLFFAISGFLITTLLLRERDSTGGISLRNFYGRRTLRIFPLYYADLAVFACAAYVLDRHSQPGQEFFRHLPLFVVYLNNWVIDLGPKRVIFAFSWSLATEEQFYIFWPSIVAFSKRRWVPPAAIGTLMCMTWAMALLLKYGIVNFGAVLNRAVTSIAPAICMGCLLAFALNERAWFGALRRPLTSRWAAPVAAALMFGLAMLPININLLRASMVLFLATVVVSNDHVLKPVLENRFVRHVGTVSYGIYLMFTLVLNLGVRALHVNEPWLKFGWTFSATTLLATVVYRYYEKPFLRLKTRFSKERAESRGGVEIVDAVGGPSL